MRRITLLLVSLCFMLGTLLAQSRVITGEVRSADDNEPVIGASVVLEGNKAKGVLTDLDGKFKITVPSSAKTLVVSFIGMKTQNVAIKGDKLKIVLHSDSQLIEEVVVTGMTKVDKRLFTGAATKIGGEKSKLDGVGDAARALEGKAAGVSVQNVSGTFGAAPKIRVRGATSIMGASKPLWVVDGVVLDDAVNVSADELASGDASTLIGSAIAGLNPDDIESFQVLKDGSATSIYGARAMAGVIVVTTKKGRAGTSRISYTGEYTYRFKPSYGDFNIMNSQQQMGIYRELDEKGWLQLADVANAANAGIYGKMWDLVTEGKLLNTETSRLDYLRQNGEYRNTDWFGELFTNNLLNSHSLSLSTGSEKASIYASVSAYLDKGWTIQSKVNRYTANLNSSFKLRPNLTLNVLSNASLRRQRAPGTTDGSVDVVSGAFKRDFDINPYSYALNSSRTLDPREYYRRNYAPFNIFSELDNNYININVVDLKFQGELKWTPLAGLDLGVLGAIKYSGNEMEHIVTEYSNQAQAYRAMGTSVIIKNNPYLYQDLNDPLGQRVTVLPEGGFFNTQHYNVMAWDFRASASYMKQMGAHLMNLYAGAEMNSSDRRVKYSDGVGIAYGMGNVQYFDPKFFQDLKDKGGTYTYLRNNYNRNVAFFANATYSLYGRYTLNGTIRYEGSNKMGESRSARWLPTWNVSGAWHMGEEKFFAALKPTVSALTLKASYSLTADRGPESVNNSTIIVRPSVPWRMPSNMQQSSFSVTASENSELTYEKKHELNLGFDAAFLGGRINASFDWYRRDNFDLIGLVNTQGTGGDLLKYGNVASMRSSGVELSLSSVNIKNKDFSWTTDFIFANAENEVTELKNISRVSDLVGNSGFSKVGYPVRSIFSFDFRGLNEYGLPTFINEKGNLTITDINFQERLKHDHLIYSGSADPRFFGSLGNTFSYKNWKLNLFLTYSFGNVVRLDPVFSARYSDLDATPREFEDRWIKSGDEKRTTVPVIVSRHQMSVSANMDYAYNAYNSSTERIAKGDFVRLKEISLTYDFPKPLVQKIGVSDLSLKLQATNLFLLYYDKKLKGQDPEFFNMGGVATPMPRQMTMTLRVGI